VICELVLIYISGFPLEPHGQQFSFQSVS